MCTVQTPDDGQMNCPKHVDFYSTNKWEKLVHLVGFIIRINHDALSPKLLYLLHSANEETVCSPVEGQLIREAFPLLSYAVH